MTDEVKPELNGRKSLDGLSAVDDAITAEDEALYSELSERAERGQLKVIPGTKKRYQ